MLKYFPPKLPGTRTHSVTKSTKRLNGNLWNWLSLQVYRTMEQQTSWYFTYPGNFQLQTVFHDAFGFTKKMIRCDLVTFMHIRGIYLCRLCLQDIWLVSLMVSDLQKLRLRKKMFQITDFCFQRGQLCAHTSTLPCASPLQTLPCPSPLQLPKN